MKRAALVVMLIGLACSSQRPEGARNSSSPSDSASESSTPPITDGAAIADGAGDGDVQTTSSPAKGVQLGAQMWLGTTREETRGTGLFRWDIPPTGDPEHLVDTKDGCEGVGLLHPRGVYLVQKTVETRPDISDCDWEADNHVTISRPTGRVVADLGRSRYASASPDGKYLAWAVPDDAQRCNDVEPGCKVPWATAYFAPISNLAAKTALPKVDGLINVRWFAKDKLMGFTSRSGGFLYSLDGSKKPFDFGGLEMGPAPVCGCILIASKDLKTLTLKRVTGEVIWKKTFEWEVDASISSDGSLTVVNEKKTLSPFESLSRLSWVDDRGTAHLMQGAEPDMGLIVSTSGSRFGFVHHRENSDVNFTLCTRVECGLSFRIPNSSQVLQLEEPDYR